MRNIEIINAINTLSAYEDMKFPQKIIFAIVKNLMLLKNHYAVYEKALAKLVNEYDSKTELDKDGNKKLHENGIPVIKSKYKAAFEKELQELLTIDVGDVELHKIPYDSFDYDNEKGQYYVFSAKDLFVLTSILCEKK